MHRRLNSRGNYSTPEEEAKIARLQAQEFPVLTTKEFDALPEFGKKGTCQCNRCGLAIRTCEFCHERLEQFDHHDIDCVPFRIKKMLRQAAVDRNLKLLTQTYNEYIRYKQGRSIYGWNLEGKWDGDDIRVERLDFEWAMDELRHIAREMRVYKHKFGTKD